MRHESDPRFFRCRSSAGHFYDTNLIFTLYKILPRDSIFIQFLEINSFYLCLNYQIWKYSILMLSGFEISKISFKKINGNFRNFQKNLILIMNLILRSLEMNFRKFWGPFYDDIMSDVDVDGILTKIDSWVPSDSVGVISSS